MATADTPMTTLATCLTSPVNKHRVQAFGAAVTSRFPSGDRPLATPPPGSNLKPVMGNYGFPFLGHVLSSLADPLSFARDRYERYGPVSWAGGVGFRVVGLMGPDALETAWVNRDKVFSSTRGWAPVIGPFFHRGIMLLDFDEHRDHRRIMQQAFTRSALDGYLELMRPSIDRTLRNWPSTRNFRFYPSIKHLLLEQAAEVFVGTHLGPNPTSCPPISTTQSVAGRHWCGRTCPAVYGPGGYGPGSGSSATSPRRFPTASAVTAPTCSRCCAAVRTRTAPGSPRPTS